MTCHNSWKWRSPSYLPAPGHLKEASKCGFFTYSRFHGRLRGSLESHNWKKHQKPLIATPCIRQASAPRHLPQHKRPISRAGRALPHRTPVSLFHTPLWSRSSFHWDQAQDPPSSTDECKSCLKVTVNKSLPLTMAGACDGCRHGSCHYSVLSSNPTSATYSLWET